MNAHPRVSAKMGAQVTAQFAESLRKAIDVAGNEAPIVLPPSMALKVLEVLVLSSETMAACAEHGGVRG